jgi:hypothetical protein
MQTENDTSNEMRAETKQVKQRERERGREGERERGREGERERGREGERERGREGERERGVEGKRQRCSRTYRPRVHPHRVHVGVEAGEDDEVAKANRGGDHPVIGAVLPHEGAIQGPQAVEHTIRGALVAVAVTVTVAGTGKGGRYDWEGRVCERVGAMTAGNAELHLERDKA